MAYAHAFSATAESTNTNTGGRVSVNGWSITIPENLIVQFPASYIPFQALAAGNFIGDEVLINGNIVRTAPIVFRNSYLPNLGWRCTHCCAGFHFQEPGQFWTGLHRHDRFR